MSSAPGQLLAHVVLFGRYLRGLGLDVTAERVSTLLRALEHLDLGRRREFKEACRAVLVGRREHLALFDRAFEWFWRADRLEPRPRIELGRMVRRSARAEAQVLAMPAGEGAEGPEGGETVMMAVKSASARERLKRKDFADLTPEEEEAVRELIRRRPFEPEERRSRRRVSAGAGETLDLRRTLRKSLRHGGEPLHLAWRRRKVRPRPLVALCDVSGSMEPYSRILLQFLYAVGNAGARREVFAFGTRLTRLTRQLRQRDADRALKEAAAAVVDWGGGTRIGESLRRFNFDWARRVLGQGAVVLLISDGWDRGEPELLAREMARLGRSCQRLIWLNPLLGRPGYEPLTRGLQAALPFVDDFLPVHDLASLEQLGRLLARLPSGGRGAGAGRAPRKERKEADRA